MLVRLHYLTPLLFVFAVACAEGGTGAEVEPTDNARPEGAGPAESTDTGIGGTADVSVVMTDGGCAGACSVGETRCDNSGVATCNPDPQSPGCNTWGPATACPTGQVCVAGACETAVICVDNDGDGYGVMCGPGEDCDDRDDAAYHGAQELCDGVDNSCNGMIDDGFDVGATCTVGSGACEAPGVMVCSPDGAGTTCDALQPGDPEVCDGLDNDCDGVIDDGVCGVCQGDIFEPNDLPADAEFVQAGAPKWGYLCPGDTDWFELETQTGVEYHVYVTFPEAQSDLLVRGWVNGANVVTGDTAGRDYEEFIVNGDSTKTFQIEVVDRDNVESFFRVSLVTNANCSNEDGFVPNQSIATAAILPASWSTQAYMCSGSLSDWFFIGDLAVGDNVYIGIAGESLGTDLDLHLWGDSDGDNVFERVSSSTNFGNVEEVDMPVPYSGPFYFEVRDFDGFGGYYDVGWSTQ